MDGIQGYGSASDGSDCQIAGKDQSAEFSGAAANGTESDDSYFGESGSDSDDSAVQRRRAAAARLRDFGEEAESTQGANGSAASFRDGSNGARPLLLTAGEALSKIAGQGPAFLNPEATRPVAQSIHRRRKAPRPTELPVAPKGRKKRGVDEGWDIASMAPRAKGEASKQAAGVISAAAVRTTPSAIDSGIVTAAQVALMGGHWKPSGGDDDINDDGRDTGQLGAPSAALPPGDRTARSTRKSATKPMPVSDFLDRGIGGAALPRSRGDRKDREKDKRGKGQSTASHWKSEAEMVLRQQYDS